MVRTTFAIVASEHKLCVDGVAKATGSGSTITVTVIGLPTQPAVVGVMVNVTVCGKLVTLFSVPVISPDPDAAMPVASVRLSLVQA